MTIDQINTAYCTFKAYGWALLGVCLMNYVDYSYFDKVGKQSVIKPDVLTMVLQISGYIIFQAKS